MLRRALLSNFVLRCHNDELGRLGPGPALGLDVGAKFRDVVETDHHVTRLDIHSLLQDRRADQAVGRPRAEVGQGLAQALPLLLDQSPLSSVCELKAILCIQ